MTLLETPRNTCTAVAAGCACLCTASCVTAHGLRAQCPYSCKFYKTWRREVLPHYSGSPLRFTFHHQVQPLRSRPRLLPTWSPRRCVAYSCVLCALLHIRHSTASADLLLKCSMHSGEVLRALGLCSAQRCCSRLHRLPARWQSLQQTAHLLAQPPPPATVGAPVQVAPAVHDDARGGPGGGAPGRRGRVLALQRCTVRAPGRILR